MKSTFCNNCGKSGHMFQHCKSPITSIGVVAFRKNTDDQIEYLMICRKDSLGYVDFVRGKYPIKDYEYLKNIFTEMTIHEKERLLKEDFSKMWKELWGGDIGIQYRGEEKSAAAKFQALQTGVYMDARLDYCVKSLIRDTNNTLWDNPEWGFPKGRRGYGEKDVSCGLREFEEETGYSKDQISLIKNLQAFEETFTGSNYKSYKHKYYVGQLPYTAQQVSECEASEVSNCRWMTFDECIGEIRPYNYEKLTVLRNIDMTLKSYCLYS